MQARLPQSAFVDSAGNVSFEWQQWLLQPQVIDITPQNPVSVANGGTGIASGTSGGVLAFIGATTAQSSGLLAAHQIVLGGGAGAVPSTPVGLGTATTVLHGNASGVPSWAKVDLAADVTGLSLGAGTLMTAANGSVFATAIPNVTRLVGVPGNSGTTVWKAYAPDGSVINTASSTTNGLQEAVNNAFLSASTLAGPGHVLWVLGGEESTGGASVINLQHKVSFPVMQGAHIIFENVTLNNGGAMAADGTMLQFDSMLLTRIEMPGTQIAAGTHSATQYAITFAPTNLLPEDHAAGITCQDSSLLATEINSVKVDLSAGSMTNFRIETDEWAGGDANSILLVTAATGGNFNSNAFRARHAHSFASIGIQIGNGAPTGGHTMQQNIYEFNGITNDGAAGTVAFKSYSSYDSGTFSINDTGLSNAIVMASGANNNSFVIPFSGTSMSSISDAGTNNQFIRAGQVLNTAGVTFGLAGSSAGAVGVANGSVGGAVVSIKAQGVTANYNFNLPDTSGSAGYLLSSNGGGSTSMGWIAPGQLPATATNDNAAAGRVGEYVSSIVANGSAVSSTGTGDYFDVTSISLTAGDWDVTVFGGLSLNAATGATFAQFGVSSTSGNSSTGLSIGNTKGESGPPTGSADAVHTVPSVRFSLASTTTLYLKARGDYSGGGPVKGYGRISARRVR